MITLDSVVVRSESSATELAGEETLLLDLGSGRYYELNPVARSIWDRLDGSAALASIADGLVESFTIEVDHARDELLYFVGELVQAGLARVVT